MKNLFIKARNFCAATVARAKAAVADVTAVVCRTRTVFACNRAEGFVDTAVFSALPVHD